MSAEPREFQTLSKSEQPELEMEAVDKKIRLKVTADRIEQIIEAEVFRLYTSGLADKEDLARLKECNNILSDCLKREKEISAPNATDSMTNDELEKMLEREELGNHP